MARVPGAAAAAAAARRASGPRRRRRLRAETGRGLSGGGAALRAPPRPARREQRRPRARGEDPRPPRLRPATPRAGPAVGPARARARAARGPPAGPAAPRGLFAPPRTQPGCHGRPRRARQPRAGPAVCRARTGGCPAHRPAQARPRRLLPNPARGAPPARPPGEEVQARGAPRGPPAKPGTRSFAGYSINLYSSCCCSHSLDAPRAVLIAPSQNTAQTKDTFSHSRACLTDVEPDKTGQHAAFQSLLPGPHQETGPHFLLGLLSRHPRPQVPASTQGNSGKSGRKN
ncbi:basic proline-rich protein [Moschus berezovskii]|uniref:basic proline-rich protein n=1 Tax=Moschus berezovskii TaxID=68408 RepID=UPI00244495B2|nr:basic proline-rich protein [Moschus berezovskii]